MATRLKTLRKTLRTTMLVVFALPIAATIQAFMSEYSHRYEVEESDLTRVEQRPPEPPKQEKKGLRERLRRRKDGAPEPADSGEP